MSGGGLCEILVTLLESVQQEADRLGGRLMYRGDDEQPSDDEVEALERLADRADGVRFALNRTRSVREQSAELDRFAELVRAGDPQAHRTAMREQVDDDPRVSRYEHGLVLVDREELRKEIEELRAKLADAEHAHELAVAGRLSATEELRRERAERSAAAIGRRIDESDMRSSLDSIPAPIRVAIDRALDDGDDEPPAPYVPLLEGDERAAAVLTSAAGETSTEIDRALDMLDAAARGDVPAGKALEQLRAATDALEESHPTILRSLDEDSTVRDGDGRIVGTVPYAAEFEAGPARLQEQVDALLVPRPGAPVIRGEYVSPVPDGPTRVYSFALCDVVDCTSNAIAGSTRCYRHTEQSPAGE